MGDFTIRVSPNTATSMREVQKAYLGALQVGSGRAADQVVQDALDAGVTVNSIYLELFQPTAYQIGELWQCNAFTVAQEHLATAIMERQMDDLHTHFKPCREQRRTLVIGCVEHELHRVGIRMVADFFEQDGWTVYYLGGDLPAASFIAMAREMKADLIGVGAQLVNHLPAVTAFVRELAQQGLDGIPVIAGGLPFTQQPDLYKTMGLHGSGGNAGEAVRLGNALLSNAEGT